MYISPTVFIMNIWRSILNNTRHTASRRTSTSKRDLPFLIDILMFDLIQYPSSSNSWIWNTCIFPFLEQGFPSVVSGNICLAAEVHKKNVLYFLFFVIFFWWGPWGLPSFFCFIDILATVLYHLYIFMSKRVYNDLKVTIQKTFHKNKHKSNYMYNENKHWMLFFLIRWSYYTPGCTDNLISYVI